jgi:hypothetical protein
LANHAAAALLAQITHPHLNHVLAAHLSERNNTPELARISLCPALNCAPSEIMVADPLLGSNWIQV